MVITRENNSAYWALRLALGLVPLIAGIDKFLNYMVDWSRYLNRNILDVIPINASSFLHIVGAWEIIIGLAVLLGATRSFGYIAMLWFWAVTIDLLSIGRYFDLALFEAGLSLGAFSLARLTAARSSVVLIREVEPQYPRRVA